MANLKELAKKGHALAPGHRACAGCTFPVILRQVLAAADTPVVCCAATGCMEVTTTIFPYTAWKTPFIHSAFENAAATISGVESAYKSLKRQGKLDREIKFIAFGGDGGTYDIGLQSLSGAMERGHNILYVCYNNEAYMNTGIQRSSATPLGADTTTSPAGKAKPGKTQQRKDLTEIMAAHHIPYVAQAAPSHWNDLITKVQKALAVDGPAFINVLMPCRLGWAFQPQYAMQIARDAVNCCYWPLYEVEDGKYKITYKPREKQPLVEFLKKETKFKHLFRPGNEHLIEQLQAEIDRRWEELLKKAGDC
ncbi:MAG: pyruvate ferredoxin oxidoreductase [Armatimonadetes bacterium]|nr:pyruvate ferredoxin oxidoreductase [Armatimonadota bacterium]